MRVGIVLNRKRARLRTIAKSVLANGYELAHGAPDRLGMILPEYDSFARVLDPSPVVVGLGDAIDWKALQDCELVIWEWGWTEEPARLALEIKRRLNVPLLMFPGPVDRFWREVAEKDLALQLEAAAATDAVGVMLRDTVPFYRHLMPAAHVFHMPVPLDIDYFAGFARERHRTTPSRVLLTAPTRFTGSASQLPIATFLAFRELVRREPRLEGLCFVYSDDERAQADDVMKALGLERRVEIASYLRPIGRYLRKIGDCSFGLFLPAEMIQGRTALIAACTKLPMVVSDEVETHRTLYGRTAVKWYDTQAAVAACGRLLDDGDFHASVAAEAATAVTYYSVEQCRARMVEGLRVALDRRTSAAGR
jgi:hypothetical protein